MLHYYKALGGTARIISSRDAPGDHQELEAFRVAARIPERAYRARGTRHEALEISGIQIHEATVWQARRCGIDDMDVIAEQKTGYADGEVEVEYES